MTTPPTAAQPADVQAAFCTVVCDEWVRAGVTDAVVAPGSRSTPMIAALSALADAGRLRVTVVLDERAAGYTAVGLSLATGRPAVVVTTSGTASVELHPAVVEAGQAGVALIAVTTDRPPELHHVGAPQTVEQAGLFGAVVRWAVDPGVADPAGAGAWRSLASRCVVEATGAGGRPGPVHVNLPFREPLLGRADAFPWPPGRPGGAPWHVAAVPAVAAVAGAPVVASGVVEMLAARAGGRGLIVAGGSSGAAAGAEEVAAVLELAERLGWPVLAEPRSGCRVPSPWVVAAADSILRTPLADDLRPDIVLRLGTPWASKVLGRWLARLPAEVPQVLLDPHGCWADPERRASHVVVASARDLEVATRWVAVASPPVSGWAGRWRRAEAGAQAVFSSALDGCLSEPAVARAVSAGVPEGGRLVVSSSMPVRDVEWFSAPRTGMSVLANRGANGIDGVISTAIGVALADDRPTVALFGDLAFLYDVSSLVGAAGRPVRLSVVVVDNDGGGIFSFLPQAAALPPDRFERYWGTPHGLDLVAVTRAFGIEAVRVTDRVVLDDFLGRAGERGIRVAVVPSDRAGNVAEHDRLNAAVASALVGASDG